MCVHLCDKLQCFVDETLSAIAANSECQGGISMRPFAVALEHGPSGGPEVLAFIHAASAKGSWPVYWYCHVMEHPTKADVFASSLIKSSAVVNGWCPATLIDRFHYSRDTYCESETFSDAVQALIEIIGAFDDMKRDPPWVIPELNESGNEYSGSPCDMRPWDIYSHKFKEKCLMTDCEQQSQIKIIPPDRCAVGAAMFGNSGACSQSAIATFPPKVAGGCRHRVGDSFSGPYTTAKPKEAIMIMTHEVSKGTSTIETDLGRAIGLALPRAGTSGYRWEASGADGAEMNRQPVQSGSSIGGETPEIFQVTPHRQGDISLRWELRAPWEAEPVEVRMVKLTVR